MSGAAACGYGPPPLASDITAAAAQPGAPATAMPMDMSVDQMDAAMTAQMRSFPVSTTGAGGRPLQPTVLAGGIKEFDLTAQVTTWQVDATRTSATMSGWC